jgi:hypothetical protein
MLSAAYCDQISFTADFFIKETNPFFVIIRSMYSDQRINLNIPDYNRKRIVLKLVWWPKNSSRYCYSYSSSQNYRLHVNTCKYQIFIRWLKTEVFDESHFSLNILLKNGSNLSLILYFCLNQYFCRFRR